MSARRPAAHEAAVDPAHRELLDRLGRAGAPHPRPRWRASSTAAIACTARAGRGAGSRRRRGARASRSYALPIERKRLPALLALRGWLAANAARFDVVNTHSSTDTWLVALALPDASGDAAGRAHAPRVDAGAQPADDALAVPARDRAHRDHRRGAARAARPRQRRPTRRASRRCAPASTSRASVPGSPAAARARLGLPARPASGSSRRCATGRATTTCSRRWRAPRAACPDWQLLVVGDGPRPRPARRRISRGSASRTTSASSASSRTTCPWLHALDLVALPSYGEEGVPQAMMQAMACGAPGGVDAGRRDPRGGRRRGHRPRRAAARRPRRWRRRLARLRDDPALRRRIGGAARVRAVARFGLDRMLDGMEAVFAGVAAVRAGGSR